MRPLSAGRLRHPIAIRRSTSAPDGKGGYIATWVTVHACRAEVEGLDGRESVMEKVLESISVYRFRVRWRPGLDIRASDQVTYAGRELNVRTPAADPDGKRQQLLFIADTSSTRSPD